MKSSLVSAMLLIGLYALDAQIPDGVYQHHEDSEGQDFIHEVKVAGDYLLYARYDAEPPTFLRTLGGHYTLENDTISITLDFDSDFVKTPINTLRLPYILEDTDLTINSRGFEKAETNSQDLDGIWLFATRGPDTGQERRGQDNPRKTLKFLKDGHFQWIAFNTETMEFSATGGGTYTAENGTYTEHIEFFSRDPSRVGAELQFNYEVQGDDWHHKGNNSKGEPMYEIWSGLE